MANLLTKRNSKTCFPCHEPITARDFVLTHCSPQHSNLFGDSTMNTTVKEQVRDRESAISAVIDYRLEALVIPVSNVNRAKQFYGNLGWRLDADFAFDNGFRVVQFTPPGSACSLQFGTKITSAAPGSAQANYLIVSDIEAAHDDLVARGVETSEVFHSSTPGAQFEAHDAGGRASGLAPDRTSYRSYATFSDPDGNGWLLQEVTTRLPGRMNHGGGCIRLRERAGERAPTCRGSSRRAREMHRAKRSELAGLVRQVHGE
jgi:catechol 2,3-dioxygenase-like lactoylglutathione lyase family enzyme